MEVVLITCHTNSNNQPSYAQIRAEFCATLSNAFAAPPTMEYHQYGGTNNQPGGPHQPTAPAGATVIDSGYFVPPIAYTTAYGMPMPPPPMPPAEIVDTDAGRHRRRGGRND